jgi:hypothetical protein
MPSVAFAYLPISLLENTTMTAAESKARAMGPTPLSIRCVVRYLGRT